MKNRTSYIILKQMELSKQIALITGGSRGIGRDIAKEFALRGAYVLINYISNRQAAEETLKEIEQAGGSGRAVGFDVSDFTEVQRSVGELSDEFDGIQILVNNAGIRNDGLLIRMGENDWDRVLDINLKGAFNCTKAVSRGMFKNRYGRIINITSTAGEVGNPGQANYSASKAGIIGLTKATAKEFSSRGITVNAVSPGFVETEIIADLNEDMRKKYLEAIPLGRFGRVEDISGAVCFLVSKNASYITGEVIKVNGGIYM